VSPVQYEMGFYIPEGGILQSARINESVVLVLVTNY
jgi:hypothetical protein